MVTRPASPLILAISTSSDVEQVALCFDGQVLGVTRTTWRRGEPRRLLQSIDTLLRQADRVDIDAVAADTGPGSFTGLRLGLATARALAWELGVCAIGVDAIDVLIDEARARGADGLLWLLIPSRAGHVYHCSVDEVGQIGRVSERDIASVVGDLQTAAPVTVVAPTLTLRQLRAAECLRRHHELPIEAPDVVRLATLASQKFDPAPTGAQGWAELLPRYVGISEAERKLDVDLPPGVLPVQLG